jgi:lysophospholipase L1-like esterase
MKPIPIPFWISAIASCSTTEARNFPVARFGNRLRPDVDNRFLVMNFRQFFLVIMTLCISLLALNGGFAQEHELEPTKTGAPPAKPQNPALVQVEDVAGLPRVLLIGDSISMGYTLQVRELLKGVANVHRPPQNCGDSATGLKQLDRWLGTGKWDVIHFNFGLHDLKYLDAKGQYVSPDQGKQVASPAEYRQHLRDFTVRAQATGAKVIFATTTPVPPGCKGRVAGDEVAYNQVALEVMKELGVAVDDLWGHVAEQQRALPPLPASAKPIPPAPRALPRPGELQNPFDVHFTPEGYNQLANLVVASIKKCLPSH